ncbi:hypothetical protein CLOHAE12215_01768 [Clostridium haemolyticum]|nr:hypothetical protein CLOHAE12215_01768 [Clostridium haemolyticum]
MCGIINMYLIGALGLINSGLKICIMILIIKALILYIKNNS